MNFVFLKKRNEQCMAQKHLYEVGVAPAADADAVQVKTYLASGPLGQN